MCSPDAEELLVVFFMTEAPDARLSRMGRCVYTNAIWIVLAKRADCIEKQWEYWLMMVVRTYRIRHTGK